jgi:hypothetical protein
LSAEVLESIVASPGLKSPSVIAVSYHDAFTATPIAQKVEGPESNISSEGGVGNIRFPINRTGAWIGQELELGVIGGLDGRFPIIRRGARIKEIFPKKATLGEDLRKVCRETGE